MAMMVEQNGQPFCGGSLLGSKWIVTAAHCLHRPLDPEDPTLDASYLFNASEFKIIMGKHRRLQSDENEQHLQVNRSYLHPQYNPTTYENDVGLVELMEGPTLNNFVMPICLPEDPTQEGTMAIVTGWGKQFLRRLPEKLMEVKFNLYPIGNDTSGPAGDLPASHRPVREVQIEIPIIGHHMCQKNYALTGDKVTEDMICAGDLEGGKDACMGDSGGPMVTLDREKGQWYLVGIVSWGEECGQKTHYGVYSDVYHNKDWIQRTTGVVN